MRANVRNSALHSLAALFFWSALSGHAAPAKPGSAAINRGDIESQLALKDKTIADLLRQIDVVQAKLVSPDAKPSSKSGDAASPSTATDLVYTKAQAHTLFAQRDKTIADLRRRLVDLQSKLAAQGSFAPAPTPPAPESKPADDAPHFHYVRSMEMKLEPSISFRPYSIATDSHGRLYVAADKLGVRVYRDGVYQRSIGYPDPKDARRAVDSNGVPIESDATAFFPQTPAILRAKDPDGQDIVMIGDEYTMRVAGHIWDPGALYVDDDIVAVADNFTETIQIFKNDRIRTSVALAVPPGGRDSQGRFTGISVMNGNRLFTLDAANNCLIDMRLDTDGQIQVYGARGTGKAELLGPVSMATHGGTHDLYICDKAHHRVVVLNTRGEYVSSFGSEGTGDGQFTSMYGIVLDQDGRIYVGDAKRIEVFAPDGSYLTQFGPVPQEVKDKPYGELKDVYGLAVDSEGTVYASDPDNFNIKVYAMDR